MSSSVRKTGGGVSDGAGVSQALFPLHRLLVEPAGGTVTGDHFRYIDCTAMAEALYSFLNETIEKELPGELAFLQFYDRAREAMRDVEDLPEITANLFLRLVHQNGGRLSKAKRGLTAFSKLTEAEITALEAAIASAHEEKFAE